MHKVQHDILKHSSAFRKNVYQEINVETPRKKKQKTKKKLENHGNHMSRKVKMKH